jgi:hypothetical protein
MYRPPFKVDGQHGAALKYTGRDRRERLASGRRTFVFNRIYLDALLTGQSVDGVYLMRVTKDGPWHKLGLTPEDATQLLDAHPLSRRRLDRLRKRSDYVGT